MIPCVKLDGILVHASLKFFVASLLCSSSLRALQFGFELEHKTMGRKKKKKKKERILKKKRTKKTKEKEGKEDKEKDEQDQQEEKRIRHTPAEPTFKVFNSLFTSTRRSFKSLFPGSTFKPFSIIS